MESALWKALRNAGVSEEDAKAAAIHAAKTDLYFMTVDKSMTELRSDMDVSLTKVDKSMMELRSDMDVSLTKMDKSMTELRSDMDVSLTKMDKSMMELRSDMERSINNASWRIIAVAAIPILLLVVGNLFLLV